MKEHSSGRRSLLKGGLALSAAGMLTGRQAAAAEATCGGLSRKDFETYIGIFSENNRDDYSRFYTDDVLYERGQNHTMHGIKEVLDFYRLVHQHLSQKLTVVNYAATDTFIGAEVHSEFTVFKDFKHESGIDWKAGEHFLLHNFVHYGLTNGRISHIKSASFRRLA